MSKVETDAEPFQINKPHRSSKVKKFIQNDKNERAFCTANIRKEAKKMQRSSDIEQKKVKMPKRKIEIKVPPPTLITVVGPKESGKSSLIRSLVKRFTNHTVTNIVGSITVVAGRSRRITFVETASDLLSLIDSSKIPDIVLLLFDARKGFEMLTFEFLTLLRTHGIAKIIGIVTFLDKFKSPKKLKDAKKSIKERFWAETHQGAKIFYLSGMKNGKYLKMEILNLSRIISVASHSVPEFRMEHPYVLVDRIEEVAVQSSKDNDTGNNTQGNFFKDANKENEDKQSNLTTTVAFYGWTRGTYLKPLSTVHIPGLGDFSISNASPSIDPCSLPSLSNKVLKSKERLIYAPYSSANGVSISDDSIFVELPAENKKVDSAESHMLSHLRTGRAIDPNQRSIKLFENMEISEKDIENPEVSLSEQKCAKGSFESIKLDLSNNTNNLLNFVPPKSFFQSELEDLESESEEEEYLRTISSKEIVMDDDKILARFAPRPNFTNPRNSESFEKKKENVELEAVGNQVKLVSPEIEVQKSDDESLNGKDEGYLQKKMQKKKSFNSDYDCSGKKTEIDDLREDFEKKSKALAEEFQSAETAIEVRGFEPGTYLKVIIENIPVDFINHLDPNRIVVLGGLKQDEAESKGCLWNEAKVKAHRWYEKVLKTGDPLFFSVGWRRFQSIPYFSARDVTRNRMLKYTPIGIHCNAVWQAPFTATSTSICAFRTISENEKKFRIVLMGTIVCISESSSLVKKLKLCGTPYEIQGNTAFISGMFNSELEVAKFEGAAIRTVSGIRGLVKKATRGIKNSAFKEGTFRATFENRILKSDIVFLRTWIKVEPQKFYFLINNLVFGGEKEWNEGMRPLYLIRREKGIEIRSNPDSEYLRDDHKRRETRLKPVPISQRLFKDLPFALKMKILEDEKRSESKKLDEREKVRESVVRQMGIVYKNLLATKVTLKNKEIQNSHLELEKEKVIKTKKRRERKQHDFARIAAKKRKR